MREILTFLTFIALILACGQEKSTEKSSSEPATEVQSDPGFGIVIHGGAALY